MRIISRKQFWSVLVVALSTASSTVVAQPYNGNRGRQPGQQGGRQRQPGEFDRDEMMGTATGKIVWLRTFGDKGFKTGTIAVKTNNNRQFQAHLTTDTKFMLGAGSALPPEKVRKLLVKDVPVVLNWRLSEEVDGRIVSDLQIRTVEINGSIKRATAKRITVTALPAQMPADEPPPIEAGGRTRQPPRPAGPPKKPMQPRTLNLLVSPEISAFTLDGEKVAFKELKPSMKFDAVIMDGGPALIFELRARNHDGSDDQGPDRTTGRSSDDKSAGRRGMEAKDKSRRS